MFSRLTIILILFLCLANRGWGQTTEALKDSSGELLPVLIRTDSSGKSSGDSLKKTARRADTSTASLVGRIEEYTQKLNKANTVQKRGFDTVQISNKLPDFEDNLNLIQEFVESRVGVSNQRSLSLSMILLTQMERQLKQWQETLLRYSNQLVENNALFNTISSDSTLKNFPNDSVLRQQYFSQIQVLSGKWEEGDSINKASLNKIAYLQNRVSISYLKVGDLINTVRGSMLNYSQKVFLPEFEYIFSSNRKEKYDSSLFSSLRKSIISNTRVFIYYTRSHEWVSLLFIIMGLLFYWWSKYTLRKVSNGTDGEMKIKQSQYLAKAPLTCTFIVAFTIAPFLYASPPMLYTELLMLVTLLSISLFAYREWNKDALGKWIVAVLFFLFFGAINLMVTTTKAERLIFLLVSISSLIYGLQLRKFLRKGDNKVKKVGEVIVLLFIILQFVSIIANVMGRYSLAKICSVTATFGLIQGFVIYYFIQILLEAIYLELESTREQSGIASYFDFQDLNKKLRSLLITLGILLWFITTLRNLNVYDYIYTTGEEILLKERTLGNAQFTYWSIVVFVIILLISSFLSKIIDYVFGNPHGSIKGISKSKMGSGVLLVRLAIYAIGFIVAFVASGIPMDKLAIIIGALGVGIGFGLQNIVNNLVSGIILAFEKPIEIGDVVEVGTRMGIVNEIGIRSSKISTYDGSTVIIPNGDLIAQHIVNWTHGNRSRRIEVLVSVAYGTEVNLCQDLIENVVSANKFIMKDPKPMILLEKFGNSSVDFRVLFWTNDIGRWVETRSEIMRAIYQKFDEKGVTIPFPQQDLHIRSIDPEVAKSLQKDK